MEHCPGIHWGTGLPLTPTVGPLCAAIQPIEPNEETSKIVPIATMQIFFMRSTFCFRRLRTLKGYLMRNARF
jgi:hypothetical protein